MLYPLSPRLEYDAPNRLHASYSTSLQGFVGASFMTTSFVLCPVPHTDSSILDLLHFFFVAATFAPCLLHTPPYHIFVRAPCLPNSYTQILMIIVSEISSMPFAHASFLDIIGASFMTAYFSLCSMTEADSCLPSEQIWCILHDCIF